MNEEPPGEGAKMVRVLIFVSIGTAALMVLLCCTPIGTAVLTGHYPVPCSYRERLKPGMSPDDVRAIAGPPHEVLGGRPERAEKYEWHYFCDSTGSILSVIFDVDEKVKETWQLD